eukprot:4574658-Amphidinium_carterae.2
MATIVWDLCSVRTSKAAKALIKESFPYLCMAFVPGSSTGYAQPLDVAVMKYQVETCEHGCLGGCFSCWPDRNAEPCQECVEALGQGGRRGRDEQHFKARTFFRSIRGGLAPQTEATHESCDDERLEDVRVELSLLEEDENEEDEDGEIEDDEDIVEPVQVKETEIPPPHQAEPAAPQPDPHPAKPKFSSLESCLALWLVYGRGPP